MKSRWRGAGVDAHEGRYFVWWGGSGGGGSDGGCGGEGDVFCLLLRLKSRSVRGTSHHLSFICNCPTVSHKVLVLSTQWMSSP